MPQVTWNEERKGICGQEMARNMPLLSHFTALYTKVTDERERERERMVNKSEKKVERVYFV